SHRSPNGDARQDRPCRGLGCDRQRAAWRGVRQERDAPGCRRRDRFPGSARRALRPGVRRHRHSRRASRRSVTLDQLLWLSSRVAYAVLPVGLGTIGFDLLLIVTVTSYLRRHLDPTAWRWLHRLSYLMFGVFALHALLAGSDFARPLVLAPAAGVVAFIAIVSLARLVFGRWETTAN